MRLPHVLSEHYSLTTICECFERTGHAMHQRPRRIIISAFITIDAPTAHRAQMECSSVHAQEVGTNCNELVAVKASSQSNVVEVLLSFARGLPYLQGRKKDCDRACSQTGCYGSKIFEQNLDIHNICFEQDFERVLIGQNVAKKSSQDFEIGQKSLLWQNLGPRFC